eukprot:4016965-Amphidinium_carterae.1
MSCNRSVCLESCESGSTLRPATILRKSFLMDLVSIWLRVTNMYAGGRSKASGACRRATSTKQFGFQPRQYVPKATDTVRMIGLGHLVPS